MQSQSHCPYHLLRSQNRKARARIPAVLDITLQRLDRLFTSRRTGRAYKGSGTEETGRREWCALAPNRGKAGQEEMKNRFFMTILAALLLIVGVIYAFAAR